MEQKTLKEIHEDVPPDYYDTGLKSNLVQRIYHSRRFNKVCSMVSKANGSILDIGCDGGTLLEKVAERAGAKTVAVFAQFLDQPQTVNRLAPGVVEDV